MEAVLPAKLVCVTPTAKARAFASCGGNLTLPLKPVEAIRQVLVRYMLSCSGCLLWGKQWEGGFSSVSCTPLLAALARTCSVSDLCRPLYRGGTCGMGCPGPPGFVSCRARLVASGFVSSQARWPVWEEAVGLTGQSSESGHGRSGGILLRASVSSSVKIPLCLSSFCLKRSLFFQEKL